MATIDIDDRRPHRGGPGDARVARRPEVHAQAVSQAISTGRGHGDRRAPGGGVARCRPDLGALLEVGSAPWGIRRGDDGQREGGDEPIAEHPTDYSFYGGSRGRIRVGEGSAHQQEATMHHDNCF